MGILFIIITVCALLLSGEIHTSTTVGTTRALCLSQCAVECGRVLRQSEKKRETMSQEIKRGRTHSQGSPNWKQRSVTFILRSSLV